MDSEGSENSMDSSEVEDCIQDSENSETDFDNSSDQSMEQDNLSSREKEEEKSANQMKLDTIFGCVYSDKKKGPLEIYKLLPGSLYEKYELVKKIMNACSEFGPIFDTFCFSLPRPYEKENSFKRAVQNMKELRKNCQEGSVEFPSIDLSEFPSEFSKQQANKLCEKIRKKLKMEPLKEKDEPPVVLYTKLVPGGEIIKVTKKRKLGTNEKDTTTELKPSFCNERKKEKSPKIRKHNHDQDGDFETNDHDNYDSDMDDFDDEEAFSDQNEEQIVNTILDNSFPHSILHLLSDGKTDILPLWCGQIQLRVNPIDKSLSFLMLDYEPSYPDKIRDEIFKEISSPEVCETIAKEVEKYECCRQLRMDIPLENLEELFVVNQSSNEVLIFSKLVPSVKFYQRFIHVSTKDRNNWTERQPFLPFEGQSFTDCSREYLLAFGGDLSEMSDILAQIKACRLDQKICMNPKKNTMSELMKDVSDNQTGKDYSFSNAKKKTEDRNIEVDFTRRNKILNVLKKHNIISKKKCDDLKKTMKVIPVKIPSGKVYNGLDDLDLDDVCLKDYLNHVCINVRELEQHLTKKLRAGDYAHEMESLNLMYPDKYDFDDMTVAEFLSAEKDDLNGWKEIFYSFCRSGPEQDSCTWHCDVCKSCEPWRTWHCPKCDKCTYGKENPICEFCGYKDYSSDFELMDLRNKRHKNQQFIIQPYTYYWEGMFSEGNTSTVKRDWNIKLSLTDIPDWTNEIKVDGKTTCTRNFILKDYLNHDDLGMVNLWRLAYRLQGSGPRRHIGLFFSQRFRCEIRSNFRL
ncbi:uncharacterized protein LOC134710631 [Mytilus trossulus]|uniref:uncharacterized protein LOC134710631 n=1 Tax=Mytilus trossulus TaxID=6551 RepID=UPI003006C2A8